MVTTYHGDRLAKAIKITKFRIKHHEKHGCGTNVIQDKRTLQIQERKRELGK